MIADGNQSLKSKDVERVRGNKVVTGSIKTNKNCKWGCNRALVWLW